jgi:tetratricopeptide (TPR) repeat protein
MSSDSARKVSNRSSYSADEIVDIYALGKMWLETGQARKAEVIMQGLNSVAPDFLPAWLGMSVVQSTLGNIEAALAAAQRALKIDPQSAQAMLCVVVASLNMNDMSTAGTLLGEVGDLIDAQTVTDPNVSRLYKMQLARYQSRTR